LKTDFTQNIDDAIDQYRFDRLPRPKGQSAEPLLSFPSGALVHFAVSNREVHMVTKLDGAATRFLPCINVPVSVPLLVHSSTPVSGREAVK
jgi:type I restriction enzyme, R subunit